MNDVLWGPFRILLLVIGLFLLHQIINRRELRTYNMDGIMRYSVLFGSTVIALIFLMVLTNVYDTFSVILIFTLFFIWRYLGIKRGGITQTLAVKRVEFLVMVFKFVERSYSLSFGSFIDNGRRFLVPKRINYVMIAAISGAFACAFSRYLFLRQDLYTLSGVWLENLEAVKNINHNIWFTENLAMPGELAAINFYARIINISEEMALHSFGLLETFCLSLIIYWSIFKLTDSKYWGPIMALMVFGFLYPLLPMNINLVLEHNPIYMALCFAIPVLLFSVSPLLLSGNKTYYTLFMVLIYVALCLVNLFVFIVTIPLFLFFALVLVKRQFLAFTVRSALAYLASLILIFGIYWAVCWINGEPFLNFFRENLILMDMYTYFPQLLLPLDDLLNSYKLLGWASFVAVMPLLYLDRAKWIPFVIFSLYYNVFLCLRFVEWTWLDTDMFYQVLTPMTVILAGAIIGLLSGYVQLLVPNNKGFRAVLATCLCMATLVLAFKGNAFAIAVDDNQDDLKTDVLLVYNQLSKNYLPYSYTVVNGDYALKISNKKHSFLSYDLFLEDYLNNDALYQAYKNDSDYLAAHPELILPATVFVFVAGDNGKADTNNLITPLETGISLMGIIDTLRKRGRQVEVFYDLNELMVYKITNRKNVSNLDELIFSM